MVFRSIRQGELLVNRDSDGAPEGEFVFLEGVYRVGERLFGALSLHLSSNRVDRSVNTLASPRLHHCTLMIQTATSVSIVEDREMQLDLVPRSRNGRQD